MTEKQKKCIDWICETLGIKYDGGNSRQGAWRFINDHMDRAKEVSFENRCLHNINFFLGRWC